MSAESRVKLPKLAAAKDCTGCGACVDACAHGVLKMSIDQDGFYKVEVENADACVGCGLCRKSCPVIETPAADYHTPECFAAWATDRELRLRSASGGLGGALAEAVIARGGVVYGAAIDGFRIRHIRVETVEEIVRIQGSKYQHSEMGGVFRSVRKDLAQGRRVLFVGMSCQVAGLLKFLGRSDRSRLVTVDTICGGLATMLPMLNLEKSGRYVAIHSFRDKEHGWCPLGFRYALKMERTDGSIENLGLDNPVLNAFSSKLTKRSSCLDCHFNGLDRHADITIGDFWGLKDYQEQHAEGVSAMVVRSEQGRALVEDMLTAGTLETRPATAAEIYACNHNLTSTHYPMVRYLPTRPHVFAALRHEDYDAFSRLISPHSLAGMPLRLYLKMHDLVCRFHK